MRLKLQCCVLALAGLLASASWAADKSAPPDLTGVWTRPNSQGGTWPNNLLPLVNSLERTDAAKAKMAEAARLIPVNPDGSFNTAGAYCLGLPMPTVTMLYGHYPLEIIQRPEQINISYEADGVIRRIYMNSKLDASELIPSRIGYSTGKWEGDTLVVETTALTDTFFHGIDDVLPHSENAKVIERYRLGKDTKGNKLLTIDTTLIDPESYPKPVEIRTQVELMRDGRILSYECGLWDRYLDQLRARSAGKSIR